INTSFNPISLDHIFEDIDPLSEWLHEKENPLLDGENVDVLPVDTSDDEMDVDQSQQQNLSHSSSNSTPSQSGDGPDGGSLSPIDEDDRHSGDRGEIRSSSRCGEEYGVGTTSELFRDRSEFDGNMFPEPKRDKSEHKSSSKGKGKNHTSIGSSSRGDRVLVTLGIVIHLLALKVFIHQNNLHMVIHNHMVIIHHFLIMVCYTSLKCILHHQCITHLHLSSKRIKSRTLSK
ncbi:hypothetical protein Goklo_025104, partial [Gossypium klotzschianum]|nr:hypothetical protein [Gossypium klotzschianum]